MVDSTDFRTGGNENAKSIIQSAGVRARHAELKNRLHPKRQMYDCKTPYLVCAMGKNQNVGWIEGYGGGRLLKKAVQQGRSE